MRRIQSLTHLTLQHKSKEKKKGVSLPFPSTCGISNTWQWKTSNIWRRTWNSPSEDPSINACNVLTSNIRVICLSSVEIQRGRHTTACNHHSLFITWTQSTRGPTEGWQSSRDHNYKEALKQGLQLNSKLIYKVALRVCVKCTHSKLWNWIMRCSL